MLNYIKKLFKHTHKFKYDYTDWTKREIKSAYGWQHKNCWLEYYKCKCGAQKRCWLKEFEYPELKITDGIEFIMTRRQIEIFYREFKENGQKYFNSI